MPTFEELNAQVDPDPLVELRRRRQIWASAPDSRGNATDSQYVPTSTIYAAIDEIETARRMYKIFEDVLDAPPWWRTPLFAFVLGLCLGVAVLPAFADPKIINVPHALQAQHLREELELRELNDRIGILREQQDALLPSHIVPEVVEHKDVLSKKELPPLVPLFDTPPETLPND